MMGNEKKELQSNYIRTHLVTLFIDGTLCVFVCVCKQHASKDKIDVFVFELKIKSQQTNEPESIHIPDIL